MPTPDVRTRPAAGRLPGPHGRFAYLGPAGTFTELALRSLPETSGACTTPAATAADALAALRRGAVDAAMLPVHNTVAGVVADTVRAVADSPAVSVLKEVALPVEFALLVRPGTRLARIRTVSGHPHAGAQVRGYLDRCLPDARWVPAPSNAEAARRVRDRKCDAAVAGDFTAARYGLHVLVTGIQDTAGAVTRFLLFARNPGGAGAGPAADRTSLVGRLRTRPEGLGGFMTDLRRHPLLRAVSVQVVSDGRGGSILFADCPGRIGQAAVTQAVDLLRLRVPGLRSLGSYPSAAPIPTRERSTTMHTESTAGTASPAQAGSGDIARLREQIDALDRFLIGTLKERLETSQEIQRIRTRSGGSPVDSGREVSIRGRYADELGEGGAGVAEALLQMCRGRAPR
ncbi:chorismate mutase [Streptomyces sp. NPDC055952]|uniref:chorismate mutase n=1 Tax=Streptomyces sp. NPDC055952 TaxID=3345663 RepID=UPI0035DC1A39